MALTPEDIFNKRFTSTRIREGYNQDEVDDFLDQVLADYRETINQVEELKQRLVARDARIAELQRQVGSTINGDVGKAAQQINDQSPIGDASNRLSEPNILPFPAQTMNDAALKPDDKSNLLQLARKLHEEHVQEGVQKRDALIAEGHSAAARVVQEAEAGLRQRLAELEKEAEEAQQDIRELQSFEKEYRHKLRDMITEQLQTLNHGTTDTGEVTPIP